MTRRRDAAAHPRAQVDPRRDSEENRLGLVRRIRKPGERGSASCDRIVAMAARLFEVECAVVSIVDTTDVWVLSAVGSTVGSLPRQQSFCQYTILGDEIFIVPDASRDERFAANPFVHGGAHRRFYAGAPVVLGPGLRVGTLGLIDRTPRQLTLRQREDLAALASWAATEIRLGMVFRAYLERGFG